VLARETGCRLHVVHVSSGEGAALIAQARAEGVDVTAETCPHYLSFTEDDLLRVGAALKCAPPLRSAQVRDELWAAVLDGRIDTVGSDHSPCSPDLKTAPNPFRVWGGIAGVQSTLQAMLTHGEERGLTLPRLTRLLSSAPARRFRLAGKGELTAGMDADFALVDVEARAELRQEALLNRWPQTSPYLGGTYRGQVREVWLRGEQVFAQGRVLGAARGRLVRPA